MENKHKFKPFDKVLVRDSNNRWKIDFYSHFNNENNGHHTMNYSLYPIPHNEILPYEGNENLVGTRDEPEDKLKPKIKTWEDVEKECPHLKDDIDTLEHDVLYDWDGLKEKIIASYKIQKLIELGYGGIVVNKEWEADTFKYCIIRQGLELKFSCAMSDYEFVSFHTPEQRREFMSYSENVELIKQYHMI